MRSGWESVYTRGFVLQLDLIGLVGDCCWYVRARAYFVYVCVIQVTPVGTTSFRACAAGMQFYRA